MLYKVEPVRNVRFYIHGDYSIEKQIKDKNGNWKTEGILNCKDLSENLRTLGTLLLELGLDIHNGKLKVVKPTYEIPAGYVVPDNLVEVNNEQS